ncbi:Rrf2 family transcriptional regulator [Desulfosporosinus sp. PR]|uniref:RrF2 family transcriptional regulator n=1 Tax=Candidatus Desulfosporosinus nitrosoreducens TaxID=3401928 RepID=UPI0027F9CB02|nr:Rrf2 family transcriptional regulator [Desulfosporosinus sp. PR]MDQ7095529.1 Rrf2 family transcriptional regulator [Desulfosporosinus sp. PR]
MKLSTKGRYGVRAMFDLAQHMGEGPISLKSISERQGISEHYLEQLVAGLRKAGLVKSVRGAQGGYLLGKEPNKITVGDIIRVLEGPIAPTDCVSEEDPECCTKAEYCITRTIWEKVRDSIAEVLDSITLQTMLEDAQKLESERNLYMYYI